MSQNERETELERQNEELRRVIRHMRSDIETLGNQVPASVPLDDKVPSSAAVDDQIPAHTKSSSMATSNNGL